MAGDQTKFDPSNNPLAPRGWLCPACGGGVAPGIHRCPCVALAPVSVPFVQPTGTGTSPFPPMTITTWPATPVEYEVINVIDYGQYSPDSLPAWRCDTQ